MDAARLERKETFTDENAPSRGETEEVVNVVLHSRFRR